MKSFKKQKSLIFFSFTVILLFVECTLENKEKENFDNHNQEVAQVNYILIETLSSEPYISYSGFFPKNGLLSTPEVAFIIAETVLKNIYGEKNIEKQKPFSINLENDIWIIEGHLEEGYMGGVAYMEIRKSNGEIVKVLHGK